VSVCVCECLCVCECVFVCVFVCVSACLSVEYIPRAPYALRAFSRNTRRAVVLGRECLCVCVYMCECVCVFVCGCVCGIYNAILCIYIPPCIYMHRFGLSALIV